jgi:hippurate hydrolase
MGRHRDEGVPLPSLHSSRFAPDAEPAIRTGVRAMTAAALELLGDPR